MCTGICMNKDLRDVLIIISVVVIILVAAIGALFTYSGMGSPLTIVESKSMQHSDTNSQLGIIDTGDMIVMVDPSKTSITTYVEGSQNGYQKFGDYGDVIIYNRNDGRNPVIHRAIIWLDYNDNGTWSAPSLKNFPKERWDVTNGDYNSMSGTLTINGLGWRHLSASINLNNLQHHSGYLTNGDNNHYNDITTYFDQSTSIADSVGPIEKNNIKAVAGLELPWLGCIKLYLSNINVDMIPVNSIPCFFVMIVDILMFFVVLSIILNCIYISMEEKRNKKEL